MVDLANKTIVFKNIHVVIFMLILILTGVPGNILVISVYTRQKKRTTALLFILILAYVDLPVSFVHPYVIFKLFRSSNQLWETTC